MARFTDKRGHEWSIEFDLGVLEDIKRDLGIDLDALIGTESERQAFGELLLGDRGRKLVSMLWILCEDQAEKRGLTPEDFPRGFSGPVIEKAMEAFLEAFLDFSPRQAMGRTLKRRLPDLLAKMDRVLETAIEARLAEDLSSGDTSSPVLPASETPAG